MGFCCVSDINSSSAHVEAKGGDAESKEGNARAGSAVASLIANLSSKTSTDWYEEELEYMKTASPDWKTKAISCFRHAANATPPHVDACIQYAELISDLDQVMAYYERALRIEHRDKACRGLMQLHYREGGEINLRLAKTNYVKIRFKTLEDYSALQVIDQQLSQLRIETQQQESKISDESTEKDEVQRDSLFEFRVMSLEDRIEHENEIKKLYKEHNITEIESMAGRKDPFAQIYWCMISNKSSSKARLYLERGKRFFEIGEERKKIRRSGVFSLLSGFLSERLLGKEQAKSHYFEASDFFNEDEAQFRLAVILQEEREIEEAKKYYELSTNQGNERARICLAEISQQDNSLLSFTTTEEITSSTSITFSEEEQRQIYDAAIVNLDREALYNLIAIAELGHAESQYEVGRRYYEGIGVRQNLQEARDWWKKAADNGVEEAKRLFSIT